MNRNEFLKTGLLGVAGLSGVQTVFSMPRKNSVRLLRHATLFIELGGVKFLVDPMFSPKDAMDPVGNAGNQTRIPMVELPISGDALKKIIEEVDAVVVTHTHRDHWDKAAQEMIPKSKPIICQPMDEETIKGQQFTHVTAVIDKLSFKGVDIWRTSGHHGSGEIEKKMGTVSGFVFSVSGQTIYVAGDTIWCSEVEESLRKFKPNAVVLNTGAPQFLTGGPITMDAGDVIKTYRSLPSAKFIAVHMETINHCLMKRADLRSALAKEGLEEKVIIPDDGEVISL
jgi:L-ascorbate metabolism protein UlaG (beta-lactamase superfamily)